MFGRRKKVYATLNREELRLLRCHLLEARNRVIKNDGSTEDFDRLLVKLAKKH